MIQIFNLNLIKYCLFVYVPDQIMSVSWKDSRQIILTAHWHYTGKAVLGVAVIFVITIERWVSLHTAQPCVVLCTTL